MEEPIILKRTVPLDTSKSKEGLDPDTGSDLMFHRDVMEEDDKKDSRRGSNDRC